MTFTIYIEDLEIEAIIGILDHERIKPQKVTADCQIVYEKREKNFVDYAKVSDLIEKKLKNGQYFLIEDALLEIINEIKNRFSFIKSIKLKLTKPNILTNCTVSVEKMKNY